MHALDLRFQKLLMKQLIEQQQARIEEIASGACADLASYRSQCGYVQALRDVMGWTEDIRKSLDESG